MEEIYINADYDKPKNPINRTGTSSFKRSFHSGVVLSLGLLSVFLLIGLITLGVHLHDSAADLSATSSKLSSMTEERDLLLANLTEKDNELERLQKKMCPTGWTKFSSSCYLLSESSGSWDAGRKDCRDKGADLVVIDSPEEQSFLSTTIKGNTWIGLNDIEKEGQWKWVDGTPLILSNWGTNEPNNGGTPHRDEDCAHLRTEAGRTWNDCPCTFSFKWICEKIP